VITDVDVLTTPDSPVTNPDTEPIVATLVVALVHTPPETVLLRLVVNPAHTLVLPDIDDGV
jgi:hypothetical protein